jgi:hypothetical protein
MAATTEIRQYTGSGPTGTAITNLRHKTDDNSSGTDTTYPLVKPSAGTNYGYVVSIALACTTSPAGTINNIKFYTDGTNSLGTGITIKGITTSSYTQATGTQGVSGDLSATVYTSGTDIFTYTSASPLAVAGSISNPSTGKISDYVRMQMALSTSVSAGTTTTETLTFRYDET